MTARRTARCPTCQTATTRDAAGRVFPFCSERCHLIDLGRWLREEFRVPAEETGGGVESVKPGADDEN